MRGVLLWSNKVSPQPEGSRRLPSGSQAALRGTTKSVMACAQVSPGRRSPQDRERLYSTVTVYEILNSVTLERYVGSSVDVLTRWRQHVKDLRSGKHGSAAFQAAWNEHDEAVFVLSIVEDCDLVDDYTLLQREREAIARLKPTYNTRDTGKPLNTKRRRLEADDLPPVLSSVDVVKVLQSLSPVVPLITGPDGDEYIPIGLLVAHLFGPRHVRAQRMRILRDPILRSASRYLMVPTSGGEQRMHCIATRELERFFARSNLV